jgi:hypothetical protein
MLRKCARLIIIFIISLTFSMGLRADPLSAAAIVAILKEINEGNLTQIYESGKLNLSELQKVKNLMQGKHTFGNDQFTD